MNPAPVARHSKGEEVKVATQFCSQCGGRPLEENASFCSGCGASVATVESIHPRTTEPDLTATPIITFRQWVFGISITLLGLLALLVMLPLFDALGAMIQPIIWDYYGL